MLKNIETLRRFVAVTETGTVHRAAELVGVTQPALTRSIKLLEEEIGAPLWERRSRGVVLTPLGERVLAQARHLLRECQLAEAEISAHRAGETGTFWLAAGPVWMSSIRPEAISRLHHNFPDLTVHLAALDYPNALPRLQNGACDAFFGGFQGTDPLPSYLIRQKAFPGRLQVIARKGHPITLRASIRAEYLLEYPWVSFQSEGAYLGTVRDVINAATGGRIEAAVVCDSMLTALELLRPGDYLALLPTSFLRSTYGDRLTTVEPEIEDISFASGMIYRRSLQTNRAFLDLMELAQARDRTLGLVRPDPARV